MGGSAPTKPIWRWVRLAIFVLLVSILFVNLGQWQLRRLDERRDKNSVVAAHVDQPPVEYQTIFNRNITDADQWQRVIVRGTYDQSSQLEAVFRSNAGQTGSEVLTPFKTDRGEWIVIDRGFITRQAANPEVVLPDPPEGEMELVGYVRRNERGNENAITPHDGQLRLIDSDAIGAALGKKFLNGYVTVTESQPADSDQLSQVVPPPPDEGPHLSYAVQWFLFTAITVIGMFLLIRSDIKAMRKAKADAAREASEATADDD